MWVQLLPLYECVIWAVSLLIDTGYASSRTSTRCCSSLRESRQSTLIITILARTASQANLVPGYPWKSELPSMQTSQYTEDVGKLHRYPRKIFSFRERYLIFFNHLLILYALANERWTHILSGRSMQHLKHARQFEQEFLACVYLASFQSHEAHQYAFQEISENKYICK